MSKSILKRPIVVFCHPITFGNPAAFELWAAANSYVTEKIDVNDDELPSWEDQLAASADSPEIAFFLSKDFNKAWVEHALQNKHGVIILSIDVAPEKASDNYRQEVRAYYRACRDLQDNYKHRPNVVIGSIETDSITVDHLVGFSSLL